MSVIFFLAENVHFTCQNWFPALTWESPHAWESHFSSVKISTLQSTSSSHFSVMYNTHNINIKLLTAQSKLEDKTCSSGTIISIIVKISCQLSTCGWEDRKQWPERHMVHSFTLTHYAMMIAALLSDSVSWAHIVLEGYSVMVQIENGT